MSLHEDLGRFKQTLSAINEGINERGVRINDTMGSLLTGAQTDIRILLAKVRGLSAQREPDAGEVANVGKEIGRLQDFMKNAPAMVNVLEQKSREMAGEFMIGDFVWHRGKPGIVKATTTKKQGSVTVEFYTGEQGSYRPRYIDKHNSADPEQQARWEQARNFDATVFDRVEALIGTPENIRRWMMHGDGEAECMQCQNETVKMILRDFPGKNEEDIRNRLIDAAVALFLGKQATKQFRSHLSAYPKQIDKRDPHALDKFFPGTMRGVYRLIIGEAKSNVWNALKQDR